MALDPYDTGRFALLNRPGVPEQGPRTAHASRGRDARFEGAIFGNSHIQLVSPERLRDATGIAFVSLTVPATGPREQFWLLDYFLAHRSGSPKALVFGIDGDWCTAEPVLPVRQPFPFWLYDPDPAAFLRGLLRWSTLEAVGQRAFVLAGLNRRPPARPDGYWDYEQNRVWRQAMVEQELAAPVASSEVNATGRFPQIERLGRTLAALPTETAVAIVMPPAYRTALPAPGSPHARSDAACRAALTEAAGMRATVIDWRTDRPESADSTLFFDHTHYRHPLARAIERDIVGAIRAQSPGR